MVWEIEYVDADPSRSVKTANELHLPVGAQVSATLASQDVIHCFWVPSLHGRQDLIPGRDNAIRLQPLEAGVYRGVCAEFCGLQHSRMHLEVVVEPQAEYSAWYERQLQSAAVDGCACSARTRRTHVERVQHVPHDRGHRCVRDRRSRSVAHREPPLACRRNAGVRRLCDGRAAARDRRRGGERGHRRRDRLGTPCRVFLGTE